MSDAAPMTHAQALAFFKKKIDRDGVKECIDRSDHARHQRLSQIPYQEICAIWQQAMQEVEAANEEWRRKSREDKETAEIAALGDIGATLKKLAVRLVEEDTGITIPPKHIDGVEARIKQLVDQTTFDAFFAEMRAKSAALSYRDVAFIACVHRLSVTDNGQRNPNYEGTSPFKRIVKASTSFKYREKPFDNRQIRYALTFLEALKFTSSVSSSVHSYQNRDQNHAGIWTISTLEMWAKIFRSDT